jgi:hypothetical protein
MLQGYVEDRGGRDYMSTPNARCLYILLLHLYIYTSIVNFRKLVIQTKLEHKNTNYQHYFLNVDKNKHSSG